MNLETLRYGTEEINLGIDRIICERRERYHHIDVRQFPSLLGLGEPAFVGSSSWTLPKSKQRWLKIGGQVWGYSHKETATAVSRAYLKIKYPKPLRAFSEQYDEITKPRSFPYFARVGWYNDMIYVDLKGAFWSILQAVGWDVEYMPGGFVGKRSSMTDFPIPQHKTARNSLVSASISKGAQMWTGKRWKQASGRNMHVNFGLWALVMDVLHGIASEMLKLGAVYVHTDGYIIPARCENTALTLLQSWGLPGRVKQRGACRVAGVGMYQIGSHNSAKYATGAAGDMDNISITYRQWLKKAFRHHAEQTRFFYGAGDEFNEISVDSWVGS
jgi:hypothetical protein